MLARVAIRLDAVKLAQKGLTRPFAANFSTDKAPKAEVKEADKKVVSRKILLSTVARKTNMTQREVKDVLDTTIAFVREVVSDDKEVRFPNFGTFKLKKIAARVRRNPSTGDNFEAPAKVKLQFKTSPNWDKTEEEK